MTEYEWLPAPAFLTKVKLLPLIPKTADVDVWLKNLNRATRKEKNPDRKRRMKIISEEIESIKDMKQSTTRKSLRDQADRLFSEYIRRKYATSTGWVDCKCGCGVNDKWKNMQCSHYVARHNDSVRWDERNAVPAFRICNYYDQDHQKKIAIFINRKFGEGTTDELERLGKQTVKLMPFEIQEIIDDLKNKIKAL